MQVSTIHPGAATGSKETISRWSADPTPAESRDGAGSVEEFERLLIEVPDWAAGLPVAAKVFECSRFKKD